MFYKLRILAEFEVEKTVRLA